MIKKFFIFLCINSSIYASESALTDPLEITVPDVTFQLPVYNISNVVDNPDFSGEQELYVSPITFIDQSPETIQLGTLRRKRQLNPIIEQPEQKKQRKQAFKVKCCEADCPEIIHSTYYLGLRQKLLNHIYRIHKPEVREQIASHCQKHHLEDGGIWRVKCIDPECDKVLTSKKRGTLQDLLISHYCATEMHNPEDYEKVVKYVNENAPRQN